MKRLDWITVVVIALAGLGATTSKIEKKRTKIEMAGQVKISLCQAVDVALKAAPGGLPYQVELELEKDKPVFEVLVLKDGKVLEIEVDVRDGAIMEMQTRGATE